MVEQKEIDNPKIDNVKSEKPVEEVKATEDIKKMEDKNQNEAMKEDKKDKDLGNAKDNKKKVKVATGPKKEEAVVNGRDLRISTKHSVAISKFIKNKNIDEALSMLDEVSKMRRAVPMSGEIPHRKGKGMMSGRYPLNAVKAFTMLLKSLKANAINHELELEKVKIACMPNNAPRPMKRHGQGKHKRAHVQIKLIPITKNK